MQRQMIRVRSHPVLVVDAKQARLTKKAELAAAVMKAKIKKQCLAAATRWRRKSRTMLRRCRRASARTPIVVSLFEEDNNFGLPLLGVQYATPHVFLRMIEIFDDDDDCQGMRLTFESFRSGPVSSMTLRSDAGDIETLRSFLYTAADGMNSSTFDLNVAEQMARFVTGIGTQSLPEVLDHFVLADDHFVHPYDSTPPWIKLAEEETECECAICLSASKGASVKTTCGHEFCGGCLETWRQTCGPGPTCPLCRADLV